MKCNLPILTAIALTLGQSAAAAAMSKPQYASAKDRIAADYKSAKAGCGPLAGNAKDVCIEQAKGDEKVALAELMARFQPTVKSRYDARLARAEAVYRVAKERCDDFSGNANDICVKEAEAARTTATADAKAQMKTADARKDASQEIAEARKDAASVKRAATYSLAKERCNALAGTEKDDCLTEARNLFGN